MKGCLDPYSAHDWQDISFTTSRGSTPVECKRCGELGYRIDHQVVAQDSGQKNEEGLF